MFLFFGCSTQTLKGVEENSLKKFHQSVFQNRMIIQINLKYIPALGDQLLFHFEGLQRFFNFEVNFEICTYKLRFVQKL